jgi:hypothetical protein
VVQFGNKGLIMNREEAKAKLLEANSGNDVYNKGIKNANSRANRIFKAIYDDFESRACKTCEHWFMAITRDKDNNNTETPTCMLFAMSDDEYTIFPDKDFGCNKWEKKQ